MVHSLFYLFFVNTRVPSLPNTLYFGSFKIIQLFYKKVRYLLYYLRSFLYLRSSFFFFKNVLISLCLSRDKIKGQSGKNTTLTPTKTLPKKYGHSPTIFKLFYPLIN